MAEWKLNDSYPLFMNMEFVHVENWDGLWWWGGPMFMVLPFETAPPAVSGLPENKFIVMNSFFGQK